MLSGPHGRWLLGGAALAALGAVGVLTVEPPEAQLQGVIAVVVALPVVAALLPAALEAVIGRLSAAVVWTALSALAGGSIGALLVDHVVRPLGPLGSALLVAAFLVGGTGAIAWASWPVWRRALAGTEEPRQTVRDFIDASALRDGRVVALARLGLLHRHMLVGPPVDARAEHFLDQLRALAGTVIEEVPAGYDPLTARASPHPRIVTGDPVAAAQARGAGLAVLEVPALAQTLRPELRRGMPLVLRLRRRGTQAHQALGSLDDGTPIVVADADTRIGDEVAVVVTRVVDQSSGRLVFADLQAPGGAGVDRRPAPGRPAPGRQLRP